MYNSLQVSPRAHPLSIPTTSLLATAMMGKQRGWSAKGQYEENFQLKARGAIAPFSAPLSTAP